uniref:DUF6875 domain-containing protein n=1 Tax=Florenciella parvula TaxID=236787 RepID=A0A7S2G6L9_9STRA
MNQTRKHMADLLTDFAPRFEKLEPSEGKIRQYKTAIFIFPDIEAEDAHETVDYVQAQVKRMFVERGLMIGEFHSANNATGLRNTSFYPLRTPYPCLAVRHMVPGDFVFMTLDSYDIDLQVKLLQGFLEVFGDEGHRKEVKEAKKAFDKATIMQITAKLNRSKAKSTSNAPSSEGPRAAGTQSC